ncbi:MAG: TIGR02281 family clan AA aspartic protease [Sphingomonadales bacterium]|nr:MAG: TIGR02281 family clan AA aspartic protease [Sphingomonadales bacterium]
MTLQEPERLIYGLVLLMIVSPALFWQAKRAGMPAVMHAAGAWTLIIAALVGIALGRRDIQDLMAHVRSELDPASGRVSAGSITFPARTDGHFWVRAEANGAQMSFLVDTGASFVTLSHADARRAGLRLDSLSYVLPLVTANGEVRAARVTLDVVRAGPLAVRDVPALVPERDPGVSLLGNSFLSRIGGYQVSQGQLTLHAAR